MMAPDMLESCPAGLTRPRSNSSWWLPLRSSIAGLLAALFTVLAGAHGEAQESRRPVTIVVPFSPGTGPDIIARIIAEKLQPKLGQPVIVDNKTGASGSIGSQAVTRAAPDGHTLMVTADPPFTANVSLMKSVIYDPVKGFTPIIEAAVGTLALVVHPSLPANSVKELIAYAKSRPGEVNYASPGVGTPHHLAMEFFKLTAKIDLMHVPFRDSAGAISNLLGGHVSAMFLPVHVALPLAPEKVRILAVATKARTPLMPDQPTLDELGFSGFDADIRYGVLGPPDMPPEIVARYNAEISEILRSADVTERLAKQGLRSAPDTPQAYAANIAQDLAKWRNVVTDAKLSTD
jgi:tripartite-type tricarboxylate transporter receptor subunit TctC